MKRKIRSVAQLAVPYILIAVLPILSILFLCGYIINSYTDTILEKQNAALDVAVKRVDEKLSFLEREAYFLASKQEFKEYLRNQYIGQPNEILDCQDIQNLLHNYARNTEVAEIYFYDSQCGRIISSNTTLNAGEMFFEYLYKPQDRTTEECIAALHNAEGNFTYNRVQKVEMNSSIKEVIEIRWAKAVGGAAKVPSQLVIALDTQRLFEDFYDAAGESGAFCVYYGDILLLQSANMQTDFGTNLPSDALGRLGGESYGAQYELNNHLRVEFVYSSLPQAQENRALVLYMILTVGIPALVCIGMCVLFTHKNHRRIAEIVGLLRGEDPADELLQTSHSVNYKLISQYARRVAEKNSDYRSELVEIQKTQKEGVLERLIRNAYRNREEMEKALKKHEIAISDEPCVAMCIQFDKICNELYTAGNVSVRDMITRLLVNHTGTQIEVFDNLSTEVVAILRADEALDMVLDDIISQLNVRVKYPYGIELRIGVGDVVASVYEVAESYQRAREVIRYCESTGKTIHLYAEMDQPEEMAFYPVVTDDKIGNYMTAGRAEDAKEVIRSIYQENFHDQTRLLSMEAIQLVKYRIAHAVFGAAERQGITVTDNAKKFLTESNLKIYFTALLDLVDMLTEQMQERKTNAQNVLAVRVREYIQEHYSNSDLSIRQIAAEFDFHENYISNLYKEEYGENLSAAIEKLRIEKASLLLESTDMRIGEVAEAVGYSSDSSFRRAFKKISGISPVDYRNTH